MSRGKVIVAKIGLDGHTTGAAVVALGLRNAGFEVVNLGTRVRPEQAVAAALEEDVDVIGLSILSGAHVHLTRLVCDLAREHGIDAAIVVGGTIPESDAAEMRASGAAAVFGPGTPMPAIVETMDRLVADRRSALRLPAAKMEAER
jgi:methylmalonyl-CoA mutase C-terminal domain/subunit